ncbi:hypothetical protein [Azomonas macrocytogenes]|uniref:Uncharacterized protein n=1 Tax=Azomonas macrocytogenes TaxID=69962 RepID=A0A839T5U0_AZOMA|nr:hypothetical protein [Azomonas macrocytogenes]MBB3103664.1 hypothetical protein [Azomonas macrocytogenes]
MSRKETQHLLAALEDNIALVTGMKERITVLSDMKTTMIYAQKNSDLRLHEY